MKKKLFFLVFLTIIPLFVFSQEDFQIQGTDSISLEAISKQLGNPIEALSWKTSEGVVLIKTAVKGGHYERRYIVKNGIAIFEDRAEMAGDWQQWYQTGANTLAANEKLETILEQIWGTWEYAMTMYHENIDKTMIIKFYKSNNNGFTESEDGYLYLYGYWYFIDGKL